MPSTCPICHSEKVSFRGSDFCLPCNWGSMVNGRCMAVRESTGRRCSRDVRAALGGLPLCWQHFHVAEREVLEELEVRAERRATAPPAAPSPTAGFVYYAERCGFVKIGKAVNVQSRLRSIALGGIVMPPGVQPGPVTLLATHAGGLIAERANHERFHADRVAGEWFRLTPALQAHIDLINARRAA